MTIVLYAIEEKFHYPSPLTGCFRECIDYCFIRNRRKISLPITSGGVYTGSVNTVGLAFDNFSALAVEGSEPEPNTSVPEPTSAIGLLIFGAVAYGLRKGK
ncbi:MAG: PEP-CTERM sorting domain-containing protein [Okeania sp. SIO2C2]|uniref:PEP-CTERM sorting domain-containing protein n=1 Tax=Okeania sp. SIO2C2 TaxID=2607787 RepID=UPI0013B61CFB|nr:PEP-CTERM sorting domain-containing protein [Okeania sp. SIO2C2]NEP86001.1 PEP-CTERM sorting domain-containing protein [Okeania sp. SIO2C2]